MKVTTSYISCACNYYPQTVDWGINGLICYASSYSVVIYDPNAGGTGRVLQTLHKHSSTVKIVHWIKKNSFEPENEIFSASLDGTLIVWTESDNSYQPTFSIETNDHLIVAQAYYLKEASENDSMLFCGVYSHDTLSIWHRKVSQNNLDRQDLKLNQKIPINVKFFTPPGNNIDIPMIIVTTDNFMTHLFGWDIDNYPTKVNFIHLKELKGHQDWIQSLDVIKSCETEVLIASGSQDGTIRIWKLTSIANNQLKDELNTQFTIGKNHFNISLESILSGHDQWVYGLHWHPPIIQDNGKIYQTLKLLSCALDKTMIIWEPNYDGIWIEKVRLGKVGGNSVGFYGCKFSQNGSSVLAYGYQGTFHIWKYDQLENKWLPKCGPSGHFSDVNDLAWEIKGRFLISTSLDQTTRIHVPWRKNFENIENWHEIGRPQIHGYDINTLALLSSSSFASGADEKVVRIFSAPLHFSQALESGIWKNPRQTSENALVPALGLTNKVIEEEKIDELDDEDVDSQRPPTEEEIIRHTLWPELEKLYGHGYEIFAMASTHDGKLLATSCKSSSQEHSTIILWSMTTLAQFQKLVSHRLTVTQLEFSPDDKYLVSVSRDRRFGLYSLSDDNTIYQLITMSPGTNSLHTRIIWCCGWTHDSKYFVTGSRDGKIGLWSPDQLKEQTNISPNTSIEIKDASVTALTFSKMFLAPNTYILAVGFDDGTIELKKVINKDSIFEWENCGKLNTSQAHHKTVKRMAFRPESELKILQLASCSSDNSVKLHTFDVDNLISTVSRGQ